MYCKDCDFADEIDLSLPKCRVNENRMKEKSCFVDNNRISKITRNLGDFNYDTIKAKPSYSQNNPS